MAEAPIVGIDLGTTNSLVAICDARGPRVIADEQNRALLPSVVRFEDDGSIVVGWEAKAQAPHFPRTTIGSVKRLMGRSRTDAQADLPHLSYEVVEGERQTARIRLPLSPGSQRLVSPEEVSAEVLKKLKEQASRALGTEITRAVVTVPAYFDDAQRQATRDAGQLAGLEIVRIVNEPTAAALAYGLGARTVRNNEPRIVAVYDLGGGTFDISILRLTPSGTEGGMSYFEVLSTHGDPRLGGDDFDHVLAGLVLEELKSAGRVKEASAALTATLAAAAEKAKCELSDRDETTLRADLDDGSIFTRRITRAELERLITPLVDRTLASCRQAVADAKKRDEGAPLDAVILVGGATRTPLVRRRIAEFFGLEPYTAIDPDQSVALGAAVQASILAGHRADALLLDVIPLSLGIETVGSAVAKLIIRNSTVPAQAKEMFSTSVDNQTSIKLTVLQGEREMAADCRSLGTFHLRGLPPMPAGIPQIEVRFLVDANGVLNVSAVEKRSGKQAALQVVPSYGLTREEVAKIEAESIEHAREDMARHRIVDLVVNSKLDIKWISERLTRLGEKLEAGYRDELGARLDELGRFVVRAETDWKSVDADEFYKAKNDLDRASVTLQEVSIAESLKGT